MNKKYDSNFYELALDFQDVLIVPAISSISSRQDVKLTRQFSFLHSSLTLSCIPILSSNMSSVTTPRVAQKMTEQGMLACLPKTTKEILSGENIIQSVGLESEPQEPFNGLLCLDVPTAYLETVVKRTKELRNKFPESILIVGNVVTSDGVKALLDNGADIVKIGIGSGSGCSTRTKTGVGYPQLSAVLKCSEAAKELEGHIISDGGCQNPGDICKAFAAGADFVMLGGMLAGHGPDNGTDFYGMSSERANNEFAGGLKDYRAAEGWEMTLPDKGPIENTLQDILGGLRSAMTYLGAENIEEMSKKAVFVQVNHQANTSLWEFRL